MAPGKAQPAIPEQRLIDAGRCGLATMFFAVIG
jgi:hypothetical protein